MTTFAKRFLNSLSSSKIKEHPFLLSILLNGVFFTLYLCLGEWKFESLDDFFMSSVLVGAYGGQYDVHLYFVNAAYGYILKPLYMLFPSVGWYALGQFFETFASFVAITYCILISLNGLWAWTVALLVLVCVLPGFWPDFAFTQCAAILTAAGILLACIGVTKNKKRFALLSALFLVAGFVMRKEMFLLGMPTLGLSLFFCSFKIRKIRRPQLAVLLAAFAAVGCLYLFDASLYKTEGYDYYAAYQGPRAFFGDGNFYDSEAAYDEFQERGLCGADVRVLRSWNFYDKSAFSLDSLRDKIEIVKRSAYTVNYLKLPLVFCLAISRSFLNTNAWCWLLLCFSILLCSSSFRKYVPWMSLGILGLSYAYMLIVNRIVNHVEVGAWLYAIVFLIPFAEECCAIKSNVVEYMLAAFFIFVVGTIGVRLWNGCFSDEGQSLISAKNQSSKWIEFEKYAKEHSDDVFLLSFEPYKEFGSNYIAPHKSILPGAWNNIFSLGYWNINLPAMEKELVKRGVTNPMRDVVHSNVYVIDGDQPMLPYYFREHYHENLVADTIVVFDDVVLLKYRIGNIDEKK